MQVSPQRHDRLRRRRRAARIIAARRVAARDKGTVVTDLPRIPAQRSKPAAARPGRVGSVTD